VRPPVTPSVQFGEQDAVDGAVRVLGRVQDHLGVGARVQPDLGILGPML
jgi:hypothetical protein